MTVFKYVLNDPRLACAKTWSNYKHHKTLQVVLRSVMYIYILRYGIEEQVTRELLPIVKIFADRGFNVSESVGMMWAEVEIPVFTKERI